MASSLTPIKVEAKVNNKPLDADISLLSVKCSFKVNEVAECQLAVGFKNEAGLNKLRGMFPISGQATYYSKAEVTVKGCPSRYSAIQNDIKLFDGYVVGYGNHKQPGEISMTLNLRGPFFKLQQIPLMAPGFHPSSPYSFDIAPVSYDGNKPKGISFENFRRNLSRTASNEDDGFEMYKAFVSQYEKSLASASTSKQGASNVFPAAVKAFGMSGGGSVLSKELDYLKTYGDTKLDFSSPDKAQIIENYFGTLIDAFVNNPSATFWEFLLHILSQFGLNIISLGSFIAGVPKIPLLLPPSNNIIYSEDIAQMSIGDFPFFSPTRSIVTMQDASSYHASQSKPATIFGEYPDSPIPTSQESATGVFAIFTQAPSFLGYIKPSKEVRNLVSDIKTMNGTKRAEKTRPKVKELKAAMKAGTLTMRQMASIYAKYILMTRRFGQRRGETVTRFMPELLPGFPAWIEDPLKVADIYCRIREVNHVLDCQAQQATSVIAVDHVRYGGEMEEYPFPNPLYGNYSADTAAKSILSDLGIQ
jgi:hypothetical protein